MKIMAKLLNKVDSHFLEKGIDIVSWSIYTGVALIAIGAILYAYATI